MTIVDRKWFLNTNFFLIKTFLITKFDCTSRKNWKKSFWNSYQTKLPKWNHFNRSLVTLFHYSFTRAAWFCKFWAGQLRGDAEMSEDHKAFIQKSLCVVSKSAFNFEKFFLCFVIDKMIFNAIHFCWKIYICRKEKILEKIRESFKEEKLTNLGTWTIIVNMDVGKLNYVLIYGFVVIA